MAPRTFRGVVERGKRRGTALGFKTANIPLTETDVSGIYAARVVLKEGDAPYMAAVYADTERRVLEAHLFDFSDELYGMDIEVALFKKIRETERFDDEAELQKAIRSDIRAVRAYFAG